MYDTEINTTLPAFFIEGDKVVETFRGDGDYHSFRGGLDLSYKVTDALRLKISGRWQRGLITGTEKEHENSVYGKLDINYFWKDFALNIYGQMKSKELSMSGIYSEQDGCYGLSLVGITATGHWKEVRIIRFRQQQDTKLSDFGGI